MALISALKVEKQATCLGRSVLSCLSLFLVALLLSACGGAGDSAGPKDKLKAEKLSPSQLRLASTSTLEAKSARMSLSMVLPGLDKPFTTDGVVDFTGQRMSMNVDLSALGVPGGQDTKMEQRLIGNMMYMKSGLFSQNLPPGKIWVKMDLEALSKEAGLPFAELIEDSRNSDPAGPLNFLQGVEGKVENLGREKVRGADTEHYRFKVDIQKASEELSPELREKMKAFFDQLPVKEFPAEAWVDEDGRVRKMAYSMVLPETPGAAEGGETVTTTLELFDFGVEADVSEPPAAEVADFQELMQAS